MSPLSRVTLLSVTTACLFLVMRVHAQDVSERLVVPEAGETQILTLDDGSTLVGRIIKAGDTEIEFKTAQGEIVITIANIREIREVPTSSITGGQYWFPNPNRTRLLVGPTARTLRQGEGYLQDIWIFFPGVAYGVTDNLTIGGGMSILPGVDEQLFYLAPKIGLPAKENLHLAVSAMIFRLWDATAGFCLGNMTYGTDDRSLTSGLGLAWHHKGLADKPAGMAGGELRMTRRTALVGEAWFIPGDNDDGVLVMVGMRFLGEQMAFDFGIAVAGEASSDDEFDDDDDTGWFPYIDFVWNF